MSYGHKSELRALELFAHPDKYVDRRTPGTPEIINAEATGEKFWGGPVPGVPVTYVPKLNGYSVKAETEPVTVLDEAKQLVYGDREAAYSHPYNDFVRIAAVWSAYMGFKIGAQDVAQMMILLKACRARVDILQGRPVKHDTVVDEAGYAECAYRVATHGADPNA